MQLEKATHISRVLMGDVQDRTPKKPGKQSQAFTGDDGYLTPAACHELLFILLWPRNRKCVK